MGCSYGRFREKDIYWPVRIVPAEAALTVNFRNKTSIFVRKTLLVRPRDRKMQCIFQARREGLAFFDEDDA